VKLRNGLPFEVAIPNETTQKVFQETDAGENITRFENVDEMFTELDL
jgi:DNA-damage-inducible protein J